MQIKQLFLQLMLDGAAVFGAIRVGVFGGKAELFAEGGDFGLETVYDRAKFGFVEDFGDLWARLDCSGALCVLPMSVKSKERLKVEILGRC